MVLSDVPIPPQVRVRAYNHLLGKSTVGVYAPPKLVRQYRKNFPESMNGAPWLVPIEGAMMRRALDQWFHQTGVQPHSLGEFQDSALLKVFATAQGTLFAAPMATDSEVRRLYGAHLVGRIEGAEESFYAISVQRRVKHPAVLAIINAAERLLCPQHA
jgi:LysR family transcriptional activator of nhaA